MLKLFLDYILSFKDTRVINLKQLINWLENPIPI